MTYNDSTKLGTSVARCHVCNTILATSDFYADRSRSAGISSRCKTCARERLSTYRDSVTTPAKRLIRELAQLAARYPSVRRRIAAEFSSHAYAR